MKKLFSYPLLLLLTSVVLTVRPVYPADITIACAANMQYVMDEINSIWHAQGDSGVEIIYGSSGKLAAQILNGAPYDLFISADTEAPARLFAAGQAVGTPKIYAYGKLVLWTDKQVDLKGGLQVLLDTSVHTIAVPDPGSAPYGRAAIAALTKAGILSTLKPRFVYGESIGQTAQYIVTGADDVGFNAESIVLSKAMRGKGVWVEIDNAFYPPIAQGAVICKYGRTNHDDRSNKLFSSLFTGKTRSILARYGYRLP